MEVATSLLHLQVNRSRFDRRLIFHGKQHHGYSTDLDQCGPDI